MQQGVRMDATRNIQQCCVRLHAALGWIHLQHTRVAVAFACLNFNCF